MPKPKKSKGKWEIFTVHYQEPVFGTEGREFHKETKIMIVGTPLGIDDAVEACAKYHHGVRVICALDTLQEKANENDSIVNSILDKKGWR